MSRRFLLAAALAALAACAACATPGARPVAEAAAPLELELRRLDGEPLRVAELRGRVVLLDIFASWCEPCRESLPFYDELARRHGPSGLTVVVVSVDEDLDALRRLLERTPVTLPVAHDPSGEVAGKLGVNAMPTLFVLDREGRVKARHESFRPSDRERIEALVKELL